MRHESVSDEADFADLVN